QGLLTQGLGHGASGVGAQRALDAQVVVPPPMAWDAHAHAQQQQQHAGQGMMYGGDMYATGGAARCDERGNSGGGGGGGEYIGGGSARWGGGGMSHNVAHVGAAEMLDDVRAGADDGRFAIDSLMRHNGE
ncbi:unnamed protein product, partial [Agarophyton chilense]